MNASTISPAVGLHAEGMTVTFGGVVALSEVSFHVEPGSIHSLIGPNGAGKSTAFNAITALYELTEGTVTWQGRRLDTLARHRIISYGVARTFQNLVMPPSQNVFDTLRLGRHHLTRTGMFGAGLHSRQARHEAARDREVIDQVSSILGLTAYLDEPVGGLPYGIRKKIEIARALCAEPQVLLLDEPVAGMNDAESRQVGEQIRHCRDEFDLTIMLVEHDMELVMGISDRITVLQSGRAIADDVPERIQENPDVIAAYLGTDATASPSDHRSVTHG